MIASTANGRAATLADLEFHEGAHVYRWQGRELPSVTKIMRAHDLGFQGFAPQSALDRGNYCHEAFPLIAEGALEWSNVPEEYVGYCRAAERYLRETETRITDAEIRLVEPDLGYCGTPDAIALRRGVRFLVEVKTGDASDWDVQAAAYVRMWNRWFPTRTVVAAEGVKLNEDGTYRTETLNIGAAWNVFSACLVLEHRTRGRSRRAA